MRITASRRDDIIRRKKEYEDARVYNQALEDEQSKRHNYDISWVYAKVEDQIRAELGDKLGDLYIRVQDRLGDAISVQIGNDRGSPRRGASASLTWSWTAVMDKDGNVRKESSSWSGLEATTLDQVADLKRIVEQLEIINSMDWAKILNVELPNWKDYQVDPSRYDPKGFGARPNFEQELMEAEIEDAIGGNVLIEGTGGRFYRGTVYYGILRDSGSQYTVLELAKTHVQSVMNGTPVNLTYTSDTATTLAELVEQAKADAYRVRKSSFFKMINDPIETLKY